MSRKSVEPTPTHALWTHRLTPRGARRQEGGHGDATPRSTADDVAKAIDRMIRLHKRHFNGKNFLQNMVDCAQLLKGPISNMKEYDSAVLGILKGHVDKSYVLVDKCRKYSWVKRKFRQHVVAEKEERIVQSMDRCAQLLNLDAYLHERHEKEKTQEEKQEVLQPVRTKKPVMIEIKLKGRAAEASTLIGRSAKILLRGNGESRPPLRVPTPEKSFVTVDFAHFYADVRRARPGAILNMNGAKIYGDGPLVISSPEVTIQNCALHIVKGIVVKASNVALVDVAVTAATDSVSALKVNASHCRLLRCDITSTLGTGVAVDEAHNVSLTNCQVHDCKGNCIWVMKGGGVELRRGCKIWGSKEFHGVSVENEGSHARIISCQVYNNYQDGVFATSGGSVDIQHSEVYGSQKYHGISVKRYGSKATIVCSKVHSNLRCGIYGGLGAQIEVDNSELYGSAKSPGLLVDGTKTHARIANCRFHSNNRSGILVSSGAQAEVEGSQCYGSRTAEGLKLEGEKSILNVVSCLVFDNCKSGIAVDTCGKLFLSKTHIFGSKKFAGLSVSGHGTSAKLTECRIYDNHLCGVCVENGEVVVDSSEICRSKHGVVVKGSDGEVRLDACKMHGNTLGNVELLSGAVAFVDGLPSTLPARARAALPSDLSPSEQMNRAESLPASFAVLGM